MGSMNRLKAKANKHFKQAKRLKANGVKVAPLEAHRTDHHRVSDGWRENKPQTSNGKMWKGAKGKTKLTRGPSAPRI